MSCGPQAQRVDGQQSLGRYITLEADGETLLTGLVVDQAALHGLLKKVRDLGMPLRSVIQLEKGAYGYQPSHAPASAERLAGRSAAQAGSAGEWYVRRQGHLSRREWRIAMNALIKANVEETHESTT